MGDERAREYVATLEDETNDGTDGPSVKVTEAPAFSRTYESLTDDATGSRGSETHGDGWYKVTSSREEERFVTVDFAVQSRTSFTAATSTPVPSTSTDWAGSISRSNSRHGRKSPKTSVGTRSDRC